MSEATTTRPPGAASAPGPIPERMRGVVLDSFDGLDGLRFADDLPVRRPGPGEILVRVHTVAANRMDLDVFRHVGVGRRVTPPRVPGIDPAGVVVEVGEGVDEFSVGERVVGKPSFSCGECDFCLDGVDHACRRLRNIGVDFDGGLAEYVVLPRRAADHIPAGLSFIDTTAVAHSFPVALLMLERGGLEPNDIVFVSPAGGSVGSAVVQLAKLRGARVIAAAGSPEKLEWVESLEPDAVIDYRAEPAFGERLKEIAGPRGVTLYCETFGDPAIWNEVTKALGRKGRITVISGHGGGRVELDITWLYTNRVSIIGSSGSSIASFRESFRLAAEGRIRPNINAVLPLERFREAYDAIAGRANRGKTVLVVRDEDEADTQRRPAAAGATPGRG